MITISITSVFHSVACCCSCCIFVILVVARRTRSASRQSKIRAIGFCDFLYNTSAVKLLLVQRYVAFARVCILALTTKIYALIHKYADEHYQMVTTTIVNKKC